MQEVDYLKYDNCANTGTSPKERYLIDLAYVLHQLLEVVSDYNSWWFKLTNDVQVQCHE